MKKWIWGLLGLVIVVGGWLVYSNSTSSKTKNENVTTSQNQKSSSSKKKATTSSKKEASSSSRKIATMASSKKIDKSSDTTLNGTLEAGLKPIDFSGTAVLIDNDKIVDSYTAGDANNDKKVKNTLTTTYEIDSLQKALTAGLVMNQINAGKLQFTDKLSKYIKDFPGGDQITIRQLLDMTSGLSMGDVTYKEANLSNSQLLKVVRKNVKFDANNIGTWNYQPVNFVILSEVIERVSGRSYEQLFNNTYVQKLGLKETEFAYDKQATDRATGYMISTDGTTSKQDPNEATVQSELGTGQVYMSVMDYYRIISELLTGNILGGQEKANQLFYSTAPNSAKYYGGLYVGNVNDRTANGYGYGFQDHIRISNDGKKALVIFSNERHSGTKTLLNEVANLEAQLLN